jgi:hypothetical protein
MLSIVTTHYKLPISRLKEFFEWNNNLFREFGCRVIVVSDAETLAEKINVPPEYGRVIPYPENLEFFSIAKTSNCGLRFAAAGIICKTDIDVVFNRDFFELVKNLKPGRGVYPYYNMAEFYGDPRPREWAAACGTLAMHFEDWDKTQGYNEGMTGYGIDDGDCICRARRNKITVDRVGRITHIAHVAGTPQRGTRRTDQWNRDTINPKNHPDNRRKIKYENKSNS